MAYGARLESVLGESPQGFESPILRQMLESPARIRPAGLSSSRPAHGPARASRPLPARASRAVYPGAPRVSPIAPTTGSGPRA